MDEQKKSLQRQLRNIEKVASTDPVPRDRQKEIWKEEVQEIEKNRASAGASEDAEDVTEAAEAAGQAEESPPDRLDMQMLSKEMEERKAIFETRIRALSEK